jgi:hypothetical protein
MTRPSLRALYIAVIFGCASLVASPSRAEPKDAAALELARKAIYTDYLATKFEDAEKKLKQAMALCKDAAACGAKVKAQLHRDLGVVYVGGMNRLDEGKAQLVLALKADAATALDADLASPEIEAAFAEARKTAGVPGGASVGSTPAAPAPSAPAAPPATPPAPASPAQGDLVHTPPPEHTVLTPVPLFAELPQGVTAARVQVGYKPYGATEWKTLEMKPMQGGYGVEVPCLDVGSATGTFKYYIQAFDAQNNLVSWSATRAAPNSVPIKMALSGEPARLPGQAPPAKCADTGDCPPEFPGCRSAFAGDQKPCEGGDCPGVETKPLDTVRKNWVSLAVQQDFLFLGGEATSCSGTGDYQCFRDTGAFYNIRPYEKSGGAIGGGVSAATTRILAGYDRAIGNFSLGVRVGFAFGGGPAAPGGKSFFPVHGEGRVAYWFGADPFGRAGVRPYLTLGGGVAQVDSSVSVIVYENEQDFIADKRTTLDAWRKAGTGFLAAGGGVLYAITPRTGPFGEVRVVQLLGASNTGMGLQLGYAFGF